MEDYSYKFYKTTAEAWDAMHEALVAAKHSIYWEVFVFVDDYVGERFLQILSEKARAGLEVKMVVDAMGGFDFSRSAEMRLRQAGVDIKFFNRLYPEFRLSRWFSRLWFRNHRKVLIVDEDTVFLGGVNVKASYKEWDDIYLKMTGAVPRPLLRGFAKSYISSGGNRRAVKHLLKPKKLERLKEFRDRLRFVAHSPRFNSKRLSRKLYMKALAMAKESVNFLTPYYAPDKQFIEALELARARGVKVNIYMPLRTDVKIMELIARAYFKLTLKAGANVYLLPKMNHGKAVTVDGKSGMVGSINVTPRSFFFQEESGVVFNDEKMVAELDQIFNQYKVISQQVDHHMINRRSYFSRFKDWLATLFEKYV